MELKLNLYNPHIIN